MRANSQPEGPLAVGDLLASVIAGSSVVDGVDMELMHRRAAEESRREAARRAWQRFFPGAGWERVDLHHESLRGWREAAERVLAWEYQPRGWLIAGRETGRAKTRVCAALLRRLMVDRRLEVSLWHAQELAAEFTDRVSYGCDEARRFAEQLGTVPLLFIDDLGQQATVAAQAERVESWLLRVFDRRVQLALPALITTNLTGRELLDKSGALRGAPFLRRVLDTCELVRVGEDGRE